MWGRLTNFASSVAGGSGHEQTLDSGSLHGVQTSGATVVDINDPTDSQLQMMEQERLIIQLKEMVRERETTISIKEAELKKLNAEFSKHKLQSKAKLTSLTQQLEQAQKVAAENADKVSVDSDESIGTFASEVSSSISEQTSRARMQLLRKKLRDKDAKLAEKDSEIQKKQYELQAKDRVILERDEVVKSLSQQLDQYVKQLDQYVKQLSPAGSDEVADNREAVIVDVDESMQQMYAQMVYKDCKIVELSDRMTQQDQAVIDMQELVGEKDEVVRGRDKAIQILQSTIKNQENAIRDQESLIVRLTSKLEKMEQEMLAIPGSNSRLHVAVTDQTLNETDNYFSSNESNIDDTSFNQSTGELLSVNYSQSSAVENSVSNLQMEVARLNACLLSVQSDVAFKDQLIESLRLQVHSLSQHTQPNIVADLVEKDSSLDVVRAEMTDKICELEKLLKLQDDNVLDYQRKLKEQQIQIDELNSSLTEMTSSNDVIASLKLQVESSRLDLETKENKLKQVIELLTLKSAEEIDVLNVVTDIRSVCLKCLKKVRGTLKVVLSELPDDDVGENEDAVDLCASVNSLENFVDTLISYTNNMKEEHLQLMEELQNCTSQKESVLADVNKELEKNKTTTAEQLHSIDSLSDTVASLTLELNTEKTKSSDNAKLLDETVERLKELESHLQVSRGECANLNDVIRSSEVRLASEKDELEAVINSKNIELQELRQQKEILDLDLASKVDRIDQLVIEVSEKEKLIEDVSRQLSQTSDQLSAANSSLRERDETIKCLTQSSDEMSSQLSETVNELEQFKQNLNEQLVSNAELRSQNLVLEGELDVSRKLQEQLNEMQQSTDTELHAELSTCYNRIAELSGQINQLRSSVASLETELSASKESSYQLSVDVANERQKVLANCEIVEELQTSLSQKEAEVVQLLQNVDDLRKELAANIMMQEDKEKHIIDLSREVENLHKQVSDLKLVESNQELALSDMQKNLSSCQLKFVEKDQELTECKDEMRKLLETLSTMEADKDQLIQNLQQSVSSLSDVNAEKDELNKVIKEKSTVLSKTEAEKEELLHIVEEKTNALLNAEAEMDRLLESLKEKISSLSKVEIERDELAKALQETSAILSNVEAEKNELHVAIQDKNSILLKAEAERENLLQSTQEKTTTLSSIEAERDSLLHRLQDKTAALSMVESERDELLKALQEKSVVLVSVEMERENLLQALENRHSELNKVLSEQKDLELIAAGLRQREVDLLAQIELLTQKQVTEAEFLNRDIECIKHTVADKEAELNSVLAELNASCKQIDACNREIEMLHSTVDSLNTKVNDKEQELIKCEMNLKHQLDELTNSSNKQLEASAAVQSELNNQIKQINEDLLLVRKDYEINAGQLADANKCIADLKEQLSMKEDEITKLLQQVSGLNDTISCLHHDIQQMSERKEELCSELKTQQDTSLLVKVELGNLKSVLEAKDCELLEHQAALKASAAELATKECEITKLADNCKSLDESIAKLDALLQESTSEIMQLRSTMSDHDAESTALQTEITNLQLKLQEACDDCHGKQCLLEKLTAECNQLHSDVENHQMARDQLTVELDVLQKSLCQKSNLVDSLSGELTAVKAELAERNLEIANSNVRFAEKDAVIDEIGREAKKLRENVAGQDEELRRRLVLTEELQVKVDQLQSELSLIVQRVEKQESEKSDLLMQIETLTAELDETRCDLNNKNHRLLKAEQESSRLCDELHESSRQVQELSAAMDTLKKTKSDLQDELKHCKELHERFDADLNEKQLEVSGLRNKVTEIETELLGIQESLQASTVKLTARDSECKELRQTLQHFTELCGEKDVRLISLEADIEQLRNELVESKCSLENETVSHARTKLSLEEVSSKCREIEELNRKYQNELDSQSVKLDLLQRSNEELAAAVEDKTSSLRGQSDEIERLKSVIISCQQTECQLHEKLVGMDKAAGDCSNEIKLLNREIELLKSEVSEKSSSNEHLLQLLSEKDVNFGQSVQELENLKSSLCDLNTLLLSKDRELNVRDTALRELEEKCNSYELEVMECRKQIDCYISTNSDLSKDVNALKMELDDVKREIEAKVAAIADLTSDVDQLRVNLLQRDDKISELSSLTDELNSVIAGLNTDITVSNDLAQCQALEINQKKMLLSEATAVLRKLSESDLLAEELVEIVDLPFDRAESVEDSKLVQYLQDVARTLVERERLLKTHAADIDKLTLQLKDSDSSAASLTSAIDELRGTSAELKNVIACHEHRISELIDQLKERDARLASLEEIGSEKSRLERALDETNSLLTSQGADLDQLHNLLTSERENNDQSQRRILDLEKQCGSLTEELQALRNDLILAQTDVEQKNRTLESLRLSLSENDSSIGSSLGEAENLQLTVGRLLAAVNEKNASLEEQIRTCSDYQIELKNEQVKSELYQQQLENLQSLNAELNNRISVQDTELASLTASLKNYESQQMATEKTVEQLNVELETRDSKIDELSTTICMLTNDLSAKAEDVMKISQQCEGLSEQHAKQQGFIEKLLTEVDVSADENRKIVEQQQQSGSVGSFSSGFEHVEIMLSELQAKLRKKNEALSSKETELTERKADVDRLNNTVSTLELTNGQLLERLAENERSLASRSEELATSEAKCKEMALKRKQLAAKVKQLMETGTGKDNTISSLGEKVSAASRSLTEKEAELEAMKKEHNLLKQQMSSNVESAASDVQRLNEMLANLQTDLNASKEFAESLSAQLQKRNAVITKVSNVIRTMAESSDASDEVEQLQNMIDTETVELDLDVSGISDLFCSMSKCIANIIQKQAERKACNAELSILRSEIIEKTTVVADLQAMIKYIHNKLDEWEIQAAEKQKRIDQLEQELYAASNSVTELQLDNERLVRELQDNKQTLVVMKKELDENQANVNVKEEKLSAEAGAIEELRQQYLAEKQALEKHIARVAGDVNDRDAKIEQLSQLLLDKDATITSYRSDLDRLQVELSEFRQGCVSGEVDVEQLKVMIAEDSQTALSSQQDPVKENLLVECENGNVEASDQAAASTQNPSDEVQCVQINESQKEIELLKEQLISDENEDVLSNAGGGNVSDAVPLQLQELLALRQQYEDASNQLACEQDKFHKMLRHLNELQVEFSQAVADQLIEVAKHEVEVGDDELAEFLSFFKGILKVITSQVDALNRSKAVIENMHETVKVKELDIIQLHNEKTLLDKVLCEKSEELESYEKKCKELSAKCKQLALKCKRLMGAKGNEGRHANVAAADDATQKDEQSGPCQSECDSFRPLACAPIEDSVSNPAERDLQADEHHAILPERVALNLHESGPGHTNLDSSFADDRAITTSRTAPERDVSCAAGPGQEMQLIDSLEKRLQVYEANVMSCVRLSAEESGDVVFTADQIQHSLSAEVEKLEELITPSEKLQRTDTSVDGLGHVDEDSEQAAVLLQAKGTKNILSEIAGRLLSMQTAVKQYNRDTALLKDELSAAHELIEDKQREIQTAKVDYEAAMIKFEKLKAKSISKVKELSEAQHLLKAQKDAQIQEMKTEHSEQVAVANGLQQEVEKLRSKLDSAEMTIVSSKTRLEELEMLLSNKNEQILTLTDLLSSSSSTKPDEQSAVASSCIETKPIDPGNDSATAASSGLLEGSSNAEASSQTDGDADSELSNCRYELDLLKSCLSTTRCGLSAVLELTAEDVHSDVNDLTPYVDKIQQMISCLRTELETKESRIAALSADVVEKELLSKKYAAAAKKLKQQLEESRRQQLASDDGEIRIQQYKDELENFRCSFADVEKQLVDRNKALDECRELLAEKEEKLLNSMQECSEQLVIKSKLTQELETLESNLSEKNAVIELLESQLHQSQIELDEAVRGDEHLKDALSKKESYVTTMEKEQELYKVELNKLREQLSARENEWSEKCSELNNVIFESRQMSDSFSTTKLMCGELQSKIADLELELTELCGRNSVLTAQNEEMSATLSKQSRELESAFEQKRTFLEEVESLKRQLTVEDENCRHILSEKQKLISNEETLLQTIEVLRMEVANLTERLKEKENRESILNESWSEAETKSSSLMHEVTALEESVQLAKAECVQLQEKVSCSERQLTDLMEQLGEKETSLESLMAVEHELKEQLTILTESNTSLIEHVNQLKNENERLSLDRLALETKLTSAEDCLKDREMEFAEKMSHQDQQISELLNRLEREKATKLEDSVRIEQLDNELESLRTDCVVLEKELSDKQLELESAILHNHQLEADYTERAAHLDQKLIEKDSECEEYKSVVETLNSKLVDYETMKKEIELLRIQINESASVIKEYDEWAYKPLSSETSRTWVNDPATDGITLEGEAVDVVCRSMQEALLSVQNEQLYRSEPVADEPAELSVSRDNFPNLWVSEQDIDDVALAQVESAAAAAAATYSEWDALKDELKTLAGENDELRGRISSEEAKLAEICLENSTLTDANVQLVHETSDLKSRLADLEVEVCSLQHELALAANQRAGKIDDETEKEDKLLEFGGNKLAAEEVMCKEFVPHRVGVSAESELLQRSDYPHEATLKQRFAELEAEHEKTLLELKFIKAQNDNRLETVKLDRSFEQENQDYVKQIESLSATKQKMLIKMKQLKETNDLLRQQLDQKEHELNTSFSDLSDAVVCKLKFESECSGQQEQIALLQKTNKELCAEIERREREITECRDNIRVLENKIEKLNETVSLQKTNIEEMSAELSGIVAEKRILEVSLAACRNEMASKCDDYEAQLSTLRFEKERKEKSLEQQIAELTENVTSSTRKLVDVQHLYDALLADSDSYQEMLQQLTVDKRQLEKTLQENSVTLEEMKAEMRELYIDLDEAQTAKRDLDSRCKELVSEQESSLQRRPEDHASASNELESELEEVRQLNSSLQAEIDGLNWKIQEFSETEEDLERLQSELFQSQAENGMLKKRLNVVEQDVRTRLNSETSEEHSRLLNESSTKSLTIDSLQTQLSSLRSEIVALKEIRDSASVLKTDTAVQCAEESDESKGIPQTVALSAAVDSDEVIQLRAAIAVCHSENEHLRQQLSSNLNVQREQSPKQTEPVDGDGALLSCVSRTSLVDQSVQTVDMQRNTFVPIRRKESSNSSGSLPVTRKFVPDDDESVGNWSSITLNDFEYTPVHLSNSVEPYSRSESTRYERVGRDVELERSLLLEQQKRLELEETVNFLLQQQQQQQDQDERISASVDPVVSSAGFGD